MAGLVAAARVAELGGTPVVYEKGDRLGGTLDEAFLTLTSEKAGSQ